MDIIIFISVVETVSMNNLTESKSHSFDDEATPALFNYEILSDELYNDTDHQGSEFIFINLEFHIT